MSKILNNIYLWLKEIAKRNDVDSIRAKKVEHEVKKNNIISICFVLLNILSVSLIRSSIKLESVIAIISLILCVLLFITSRMWNFWLCPEKKIIERYVSIQVIIRTLMIVNYCINITLGKFALFSYLVLVFTISDMALGFIITSKSKKIQMKNDNFLPTPITEWEKKNFDTLSDSISYIGVWLYLFSIYIVNDALSMESAVLKIFIFSIAIHRINRKLSNFYENMDCYKRVIIKVDSFLIIGFLIGLFGNLIGCYYLNVDGDTYKNLNDAFILIGIVFAWPLFSEYARIGRRIKEITKPEML